MAKTFQARQYRIERAQGHHARCPEGEYVSIIGHSGCGKSTLLNIVAVFACNRAACCSKAARSTRQADRAVVFQNHSLLPWLTVYDNVRLAVDKVFSGRKSRAERHEWTLHNLGLVHMTHALDKRPAEISGGMKQRVGIARALAMEPKVLLLDEPFGALDALTRAHLQDEVMPIHAKLGNTVMMVTHDVDEAVLLSDRIVMMTNGPAATIGEILDVRAAAPAQPHRAGRGLALPALPAGDPRPSCTSKQRKVEPITARTSCVNARAWPHEAAQEERAPKDPAHAPPPSLPP